MEMRTIEPKLPELMNSPWLSQVMSYALVKARHSLPDHVQYDDSALKQIIGKPKSFRE